METVIIVLGIIGLIMSVPIIAILTHHQRKMAAIKSEQPNRDIDATTVSQLVQEVAELRQLVAQQAIILDDVSMIHRRLLERSSNDDSVRQRLGS